MDVELLRSNQFNKLAHVVRHMELRVVVRDGLLDPVSHRVMKMITSYISATYELKPDGMDLESALFENVDDALCRKIIDDIKTRFRRHLRYIEVECL
jgi:hypothetical protein